MKPRENFNLKEGNVFTPCAPLGIPAARPIIRNLGDVYCHKDYIQQDLNLVDKNKKPCWSFIKDGTKLLFASPGSSFHSKSTFYEGPLKS